MIKKITTAALLLATLSGCAAKPQVNHEVDDLLGDLAPLNTQTPTGWAQSVQHEFNRRVPTLDSYAGKACAVRMKFAPSGMLLSATAEGGDPALCQTTLATMQQMTFPPLPTELQQQKSILIDIKP